MSARSIASYERQIAELKASEDLLIKELGHKLGLWAMTRALATELAAVLAGITPADAEPEGRYVVWGASDRAYVTRAQAAIERARIAGLL